MLYLQRSIDKDKPVGRETVVQFRFTDIKEFPDWWLVVSVMRGVVFIALLFVAQAHADIYQCVDKDGHVLSQPTACAEDSQSAKKIDQEELLKKQNTHHILKASE